METKHIHDPTWNGPEFTTFFTQHGYKQLEVDNALIMVKPETNQIAAWTKGEVYKFKASTQEEFDACMDELIPPEETKK
jgi:hypothetical protein